VDALLKGARGLGWAGFDTIRPWSGVKGGVGVVLG